MKHRCPPFFPTLLRDKAFNIHSAMEPQQQFKMNFQNFQKAVADLQNLCTNLVQNISTTVTHRTNPPLWARIAQNGTKPMSTESIEHRLEGVPVYALSNATDEFLLVSGASNGKNLGLFCFNKDDAEALLNQVTAIDPHIRQGSKVVPVALNKVFQLKVNGVAFRLIPEFSQVKNALHEREKSGVPTDDFYGVPVFQSRSLILKNQNKKYRPLFFRKEDLESSLKMASGQQNTLNPALRPGDIEVGSLEDVIKGMKENSTSKWDDVVFIPPGFDISADPNKQ